MQNYLLRLIIINIRILKMSAFDNDNNLTDPYNTDKFNVPQLLRH
jgi:hypothetical protein